MENYTLEIEKKRKRREEQGVRRKKIIYFGLEIQNDSPLSITQKTEKVSLKNPQPFRITS